MCVYICVCMYVCMRHILHKQSDAHMINLFQFSYLGFRNMAATSTSAIVPLICTIYACSNQI